MQEGGSPIWKNFQRRDQSKNLPPWIFWKNYSTFSRRCFFKEINFIDKIFNYVFHDRIVLNLRNNAVHRLRLSLGSRLGSRRLSEL
jgi:hypothetical protein